MKIFWSTNIPSPYRVDFFNMLGSKNDLFVLFENVDSKERNSSWKAFNNEHFSYTFLKGIRYGTTSLVPVFASFQFDKLFKKNKYDIVVVSNYSSIAGVLLVKYLRRKHIKYIIEGDGAFLKKHESRFKFNLKKKIISGSALCFSTSDVHDEYYLKYGCFKEDLRRFTLSSVRMSSKINVESSLQQLINEPINCSKKTIATIGQFIDRKNNELFIEIASRLSEYNFLLIGEGPKLNNYLKIIKDKNISNVFIIPFMPHEKLMKVLSLTDLFLFTTKEDIWGLVINEALSCGVPVVSSKNCLAAKELIIDGKNGFIVNDDNVDSYIDKIELCFKVECLPSLKNYCLSHLFDYSLERMVEQHELVFREYCEKKNLLFIGYYTNNTFATGISIAGNKMQANILKSIDETDFFIRVVSIEPLAPWPRDSVKHHKQIYFDNTIGKTITSPKFLNIQFLKQLSQRKNLKKVFSFLTHKYHIDKALSFNTFPVVGSVLKLCKKNSIEICSFVADLPISQTRYKFPSSLFRKIMDKETIKYMKLLDKIIVINENIIKMFDLNQPYITINGFYDESHFENNDVLDTSLRIERPSFFFAGSFNHYNCIETILELFSASSSLHLYICGKGELEPSVESYSKAHPNIHYLGWKPNKLIFSIEKQMDYLLLFRKPNDQIIQGTFPSKIFEYATIGKPIIINSNSSLPKSIVENCFEIDIFNKKEAIEKLLFIASSSDFDGIRKAKSLHLLLKEEYSLSCLKKKITEFLNETYE